VAGNSADGAPFRRVGYGYWLMEVKYAIGLPSAIAAATDRIRIILTVTLPRRQVQEVAQDTAAVDALSRGRLTVLAIIGG